MKKTVTGWFIGILIAAMLSGCGARENGLNAEGVPGLAASQPAVQEEKGEGVMTYAEYMAAKEETPVVVETYVQAVQSLWEGTVSIYSEDHEGGYFIYDMYCSEEEYARLIPGQKIKVSGTKSQWSGEIEIIDAVIEFEEGSYIAPALDVTQLLGKEELIQYQNRFVRFEDLTVEAADRETGAVYMYKWDGSGKEGDDLYFNVSKDGQTFTFTVESDLCSADTDVYQAVKNLKIGDKVDLEGFLYWYDGVNPHVTSVTVR